jgi:CRISPR-associated protein Csx17
MSANHAILSVIPVPGLNPTSLGAYLAALGLLKILSRRWPDVRAAWRDGVLHVVGGPTDRDTLADALMGFADQASWTPYERGWTAAQKASTKAKSGAKLAHWQARADENELELFAAHAAPASRIFFNPLLGSGGNAGKRAFADGWKKAADALKAPASPKKSKNATNADNRREALTAFLQGETLEWQAEKLNAASWFSDANKLYNSGQSAYSEGAISPWAMALACEGLAFFAGGASRRLGARTRPVGAFPFVVASAAPETSGEAGRDRGEVWTPLWNRPMTAPELAALFARGRAEIAGRSAVTPAAFAAAVTRRGVDAGITEFRRFALGKTTSGNTFEPRYLGATQVPTAAAAARSEAFERALNLIEKLPSDKKVGQRWRFVGLRGPIESALVRAAGAPADSEAAVALLDATVVSLDRVDVNRSFREQSVAWRPLPLAWLAGLFEGDAPDVEARLALSLASAFPADYPFALYRFGVEWRGGNRDGRPRKNSAYIHSKTSPARWVWRAGPLARNLGAVLQRRLLDWENEHERGAPPAFARITARLSDIEAWLDENVDEALLARWLSRFALFDWSFDRNDAMALLTLDNKWSPPTPVGPALALYGLLSPLFDLRPVRESGQRDGRDLLAPNTGARTPAAARKIAALIRGGDVERAVDVARSRYAMANAPLMSTDAPCAVNDPERLLTALLFPVSSAVRAALVRRWLRPQRQSDEVTHA